MNTTRTGMALYVLCSLLYGFVVYVWIVILIRLLNSGQDVDFLWAIIPQIIIVFVALLASLYRRPHILLATSIFIFFPLGLYLLGGEGLAQMGGMASVAGVTVSIVVFWQHKRKGKQALAQNSS